MGSQYVLRHSVDFASEAEEVRCLDEELLSIVEELRATRRDRVVSIARSTGETIAERTVQILQVVVVADIDRRARVREPGEERLCGNLLGARERGLCKIDQRRIILHNDARRDRSRELIVDLDRKSVV